MIAEKLIDSEEFNELVRWYCYRRGVDHHEMTQEIFAQILESGADTFEECKKVADRVTKQEYRLKHDIRDHEISYSDGDHEYDVENTYTKNWYWRGVDPRMNVDVDKDLAWE